VVINTLLIYSIKVIETGMKLPLFLCYSVTYVYHLPYYQYVLIFLEQSEDL